MVAITYKIPPSIPQEAVRDIEAQPKRMSMSRGIDHLVFVFDHTPEESAAFKKFLLNKIFLYDEDIFQYIDTIQSPVLNGIRGNSVDVATNYTVQDNDWRIRVNATLLPITITIPSAVGRWGKIFVIRKIDTSFNIVSVVAQQGQTINGFSSWELRNPDDLVEIFSDGITWKVIDYSSYDYNGYRRIGTLIPNRYYIAGMDSQGALGAPAAVVANTLYTMPIMIGRGGTIDRLGVNVSTAIAASNVRMGIYRNLNGIPGTLLLDAGTVATTTPAGLKEIIISQNLQPGLYWIAAVFSHAPTIRQVASQNIMGILGVDNAATTAVGTGYTSAFIYAALPAIFPVVTVSTAATQPALFYHFSA